MTFTELLLSWYAENKRDLPWRRTRDPYIIWVSEIILQQTRIEQGLSYFYRFLEAFPSVEHLAGASEQEVLNVWQGLGYYSRARNMHLAAKEIVTNFHAHFPDDYDDLLKLKGVGQYTAAAVASMAFNLPYPVIDGNVLRFFSRFFGVLLPVDQQGGKKKILELARHYFDENMPGEFNQAVMEFGALQCKPGKPDCDPCPLNKECYALNHDRVSELPVKSKTRDQRERYFHYFVILREEGNEKFIFLKKRESNDIWRNLYDFPLIESKTHVSAGKLRKTGKWEEIFGKKKITILHQSKTFKHLLTHQVIQARFYSISDPGEVAGQFTKVALQEIDNYPFPRLIENFLNDFLKKLLSLI